VPSLESYLAFLVALLAYQLSGPGPDMLLVISRGVGIGRRAALVTALGCVAAGVVQVPLLAIGVATLINSSDVAQLALRCIGGAYLIYIGIRCLLCAQPIVSQAPSVSGAPSAFRQGLLSNLTNPQTLAFMLALMPHFVDPSAGSVTLQFIVLGVTMKFTGMLVLGAVALASGSAGEWIARRPGVLAWQARFAGAALVGLGLYFLVGAWNRVRT
jgi:threonine/homoserine/homoserine lactone efflux protein